jgi:uncharacterized protein YukE
VTVTPGDPASLSSLASELARTAEALRERHGALSRAEEQLAEWSGRAAEGFRTAFRTQLRALDDTAEALAECVSALQEYTVELQHARALTLEAEDYCHRHGLEIADGIVRMPWGPYSLEDAGQLAEYVPDGQRVLDRAGEDAEDAARRLAGRVDAPVHELGVAGQAVLAAVQLATSAASTT